MKACDGRILRIDLSKRGFVNQIGSTLLYGTACSTAITTNTDGIARPAGRPKEHQQPLN